MRPVEIALKLIELLGIHQPVGVTELAQLTKLPKSTIQRNLLALQKTGWIEMRDPGRAQWTLTIRASIATTGRVTDDQNDLRSVAIPVMEELRRTTKETIVLSYKFDNAMVLVERLDGMSPVKHFARRGTVFGLRASAAGWSIFAKLTPTELEEHLARPPLKLTSQEAVPPRDLRQEIRTTKKAGYAVAKYPVGYAVAAAICDPLNQPFAALGLTSQVEPVTQVLLKKWGPLIADGARRISIGAAALSGAFIP